MTSTELLSKADWDNATRIADEHAVILAVRRSDVAKVVARLAPDYPDHSQAELTKAVETFFEKVIDAVVDDPAHITGRRIDFSTTWNTALERMAVKVEA